MRNRLPTIVLKLQQNATSNQDHRQNFSNRVKKSYKSDQELDHLFESSLAELKRELNENIDDFHQQILSAKPHPSEQQRDPDGYAAHMNAYHHFLQLANEIVKHMQQSFTAVLNCYREHIERLWAAVQHGHDMHPLQRQFKEELRQNMERNWTPVFQQADDLIREINMNLGDSRQRANVASVRSPRHHQ